MTLSDAKLTSVLVIALCGLNQLSANYIHIADQPRLGPSRHLRSLLQDQPPTSLQEDREALHKLLSEPSPHHPEGILIPAGGREQLINCAAVVVLIREYFRSKLPIEIFYNGQNERYDPAIQFIEVQYHRNACSDLVKTPRSETILREACS